MKTIQLEINFPMFEGFYYSQLDLAENIEVGEGDDYCMNEEQFDEIDWNKTNENISKFYLDYFKDGLSDFFKSIGVLSLEFIKVDSPKYYNYSTDKLVCNIETTSTITKKDKQLLRKCIKNNLEDTFMNNLSTRFIQKNIIRIHDINKTEFKTIFLCM